MFDFRYHVASLAAVFIALVVGIVIGVGLSGQGVLDEGERENLNQLLDNERRENERLNQQLENQAAAEEVLARAYPTIMENRLAGKRFALVLVGRGNALDAAERAIEDAGGSVEQFRSLRLPIDPERIAELAEDEDLRDVGQELGRELLDGGETPMWDALAEELVLEQDRGDEPVDGVVVARTAEAQEGPTAVFLSGLYDGLSGAVPAVWIAPPDDGAGRVPPGLTPVDSVGLPEGAIRLATMLAGGDPDEEIEPVEPPTADGG